MKRSAGILPYKMCGKRVCVYLGHLGGPFWRNKQRSWGIIKGEIEPNESDLDAAKREFYEETGKKIDGAFVDLGEVKSSNKIVHVYALKSDLDTDISSNMISMEYKGKTIQFPEIDQARWFDIEEAKEMILSYQEPFLERLQRSIGFEK